MPDPGRIAGSVVIPGAIEIRLAWALANAKAVHNVLHGRVAGGFVVTSAIAEAVFAAIKADSRWTDLRSDLSSAVSFTGVDLRDLRAANQALAASTGAASAGSAVGNPLPPEVAFCVTLRTNLAGRSNRGRVYLPGFNDTALAAGGVLAATGVGHAQAFVQAVSDALDAQGITLVIANPARAEYTGTTGAHHAARAAGTVDVTSIVARDNVFDSQRRRSH